MDIQIWYFLRNEIPQFLQVKVRNAHEYAGQLGDKLQGIGRTSPHRL